MKTDQPIRIFDSSSADYHKAFQVFLDHTDQKAKARERLDELVSDLSSRRVLIDAGAGNGKVTAWFTDAFEHTIAAEPNASLRKELKETCPRAEVLEQTILDARISHKGDFILASHVFYYIKGDEWLKNLETLASWLSPEGTLVVILQNHGSDCMKMLRHFLGQSFNLEELADDFGKNNSPRYRLSLDTVPSHITTPDLDAAYTVAEFMLNLLPLPNPPSETEVSKYVQTHFAQGPNKYRFSCTQDFLEIRRR
ncbi:MAG: methyltransferase domain-containing protein [Candidatus Omnitrophica bacterium]|nr:methyltransferase domain-containing protein [Candidatus Omnitrophota bacterium]